MAICHVCTKKNIMAVVFVTNFVKFSTDLYLEPSQTSLQKNAPS